MSPQRCRDLPVQDMPDSRAVRGTAIEGDGSIVFVFSGNGSQWSGMGRVAYRSSAAFRDALAEIDSHFAPLSGWSLVKELGSQDLENDLAHTHIAQPLMFAIQAASVRALAAIGVRPSMTMGHSVGEVAAAEAAGVLSLPDAVRLIYNRSRLQELTESTGGMAVIFGARDAAIGLVEQIRRPDDRGAQFASLCRGRGDSRGIGSAGEARPGAQGRGSADSTFPILSTPN